MQTAGSPRRPTTGAFLQSPAVGPELTSLVLETPAATCLTPRITFRLLVVLSAVTHIALLTVMTSVIAPGENPIFHLMMPHLNVAVSSHMKTFPAISTAFSWFSAFSFDGLSRVAPWATLVTSPLKTF